MGWRAFTKPLLLVSGEPKISPLTHYLPEILAVEGYLYWDIIDLREEKLGASSLKDRAVVILGAVQVDEETQNMLIKFAEGGGALIAMLPPRKMLSTLGIKALEGVYSKASDIYLYVNADHPWMRGFPASSFQFHGDAQLYEPQNGATLVFFAGQPDSHVPYPAVWARRVGKGWMGLFAFDLATSVALTHQGVPREKVYDGNPDRDRDGEKSTGEIFEELTKSGESISKSGLYYHLSELEKVGIIELAMYCEAGGGAPEKVWRLKTKEIKISLLDMYDET